MRNAGLRGWSGGGAHLGDSIWVAGEARAVDFLAAGRRPLSLLAALRNVKKAFQMFPSLLVLALASSGNLQIGPCSEAIFSLSYILFTK